MHSSDPIGTTQDLGKSDFHANEGSVVGVLFDLPPVGGLTISGELQFVTRRHSPSFMTLSLHRYELRSRARSRGQVFT